MFKRHQSGETVKGGTYLNIKSGEFASVPGGCGTLPEGAPGSYIAINPAMALLVGPLAGLLFVLVLPVLALVYVGYSLGRRVLRRPKWSTAGTPVKSTRH